jgi:hypothetical protein
MTRTMGVLTKPDLNIERTTQQIAIDHVNGTRRDLTLGYFIVKNRGPDDTHKSLEEGQQDERKFFAGEPWSDLRNTGRAGTEALKQRVRELLIDLIRKEFPKLKADITKKLMIFRSQRDGLGDKRNTPHTQRMYLNSMCEKFQAITRDALEANYTGSAPFLNMQDVRLITRVVELSDEYSDLMSRKGHTRPFSQIVSKQSCDERGEEDGGLSAKALGEVSGYHEEITHRSQQDGSLFSKTNSSLNSSSNDDFSWVNPEYYTELDNIIDISSESCGTPSGEDDIMSYIGSVYNDSRGLDLGIVRILPPS